MDHGTSSDSKQAIEDFVRLAVSATTMLEEGVRKEGRKGSVVVQAPNRDFSKQKAEDTLDKYISCRNNEGTPLFSERERV